MAEETQKIANVLDFLASPGTLKKSVIFASSLKGCVEL